MGGSVFSTIVDLLLFLSLAKLNLLCMIGEIRLSFRGANTRDIISSVAVSRSVKFVRRLLIFTPSFMT